MQSIPFNALGVSETVVAALAARGIDAPFPIQQLVLPDAIAGRDVLARSPTGSGKTLAFAIPLVERLRRDSPTPSALVLVPTRELAMQVAAESEAIAGSRGLRVALAYGGAGIQRQAALAARAHLLVATPGRLEDLIARRLVRLDSVSLLVLDEADRMLDLGFRPAVDRIVARTSPKRQTMFFSATLDGEVGRLARAYTRDPIHVETRGPADTAPAVDHRFLTVEHADKLDALVDVLGRERSLALVFVRTKRGAARLAQRLERRGISAAALHGDMSQSARTSSLARFASGRADTLVATDVAARGLDVDEITHVVNFDPPADDAGYVHRVGRTGRAGRTGTGITLVMPDQRADVARMAAGAGVADARCERTGTPLLEQGAPRPPRPGGSTARPSSAPRQPGSAARRRGGRRRAAR